MVREEERSGVDVTPRSTRIPATPGMKEADENTAEWGRAFLKQCGVREGVADSIAAKLEEDGYDTRRKFILVEVEEFIAAGASKGDAKLLVEQMFYEVPRSVVRRLGDDGPGGGEAGRGVKAWDLGVEFPRVGGGTGPYAVPQGDMMRVWFDKVKVSIARYDGAYAKLVRKVIEDPGCEDEDIDDIVEEASEESERQLAAELAKTLPVSTWKYVRAKTAKVDSGLFVILQLARAVDRVTERGVKAAIKAVTDPAAVQFKGALFEAVSVWCEAHDVLDEAGEVPPKSMLLEGLEKLASKVPEAKRKLEVRREVCEDKGSRFRWKEALKILQGKGDDWRDEPRGAPAAPQKEGRKDHQKEQGGGAGAGAAADAYTHVMVDAQRMRMHA